MATKIGRGGFGRVGHSGKGLKSYISGHALMKNIHFKLPIPKISMYTDGVNVYKKNIKSIKKSINNSSSSTYKAVQTSCKLVAVEAQRLILSGDMEAFDTGKLFNSINYFIESYTLDYILGFAGSFDVLYSVFVHEGTIKMPPRPFLKQALLNKEKHIVRLIQNAVLVDIKKGLI